MIVRVTQRWHAGEKLDSRSANMVDSPKGRLLLTRRGEERYATLASLPSPLTNEPITELLPRLWSFEVLESTDDSITIRGMQRYNKKLVCQEWWCLIMKNQHP